MPKLERNSVTVLSSNLEEKVMMNRGLQRDGAFLFIRVVTEHNNMKRNPRKNIPVFFVCIYSYCDILKWRLSLICSEEVFAGF